jgi:hypothetical protein
MATVARSLSAVMGETVDARHPQKAGCAACTHHSFYLFLFHTEYIHIFYYFNLYICFNYFSYFQSFFVLQVGVS